MWMFIANLFIIVKKKKKGSNNPNAHQWMNE